jgi:hypothetical protein
LVKRCRDEKADEKVPGLFSPSDEKVPGLFSEGHNKPGTFSLMAVRSEAFGWTGGLGSWNGKTIIAGLGCFV